MFEFIKIMLQVYEIYIQYGCIQFYNNIILLRRVYYVFEYVMNTFKYHQNLKYYVPF